MPEPKLTTPAAVSNYLEQRFSSGATDEEICFDGALTLLPKPLLVGAVREALSAAKCKKRKRKKATA